MFTNDHSVIFVSFLLVHTALLNSFKIPLAKKDNHILYQCSKVLLQYKTGGTLLTLYWSPVRSKSEVFLILVCSRDAPVLRETFSTLIFLKTNSISPMLNKSFVFTGVC